MLELISSRSLLMLLKCWVKT